MSTTTNDTMRQTGCNRCKDTGCNPVAFYSTRDTRCSCARGQFLRRPDADEILAYLTALDVAQRRADRHARRDARRAAALDQSP